jgi:Sen15 protein
MAAQNFTDAKIYTRFHHPVLTAYPPPTAINPKPTQCIFLVLYNDEKVSTKLFAGAFAWINENVLHDDEETGGRIQEDWGTLHAAIVHPDSTIAYYKVHDGVHKPLEGMAGV